MAVRFDPVVNATSSIAVSDSMLYVAGAVGP